MTSEERVIQVHARVNDLQKTVSKMVGIGLATALMAGSIAAMAVYHVNYRFSNIEKSLEKIEKKITNVQWQQKKNQITLISP